MICKHCLLMAYFLLNTSVHFILYVKCSIFLNFLILHLHSFIAWPIYICPAINYLLDPACLGIFLILRIYSLETCLIHPLWFRLVTFVECSVHLVDFILHPSILDFKLSPFWGDPSTLWILFYFRPFCGLQVAILVEWSVHLVDFKWSSFWDDPSTLWTSFCIRPSCGQL